MARKTTNKKANGTPEPRALTTMLYECSTSTIAPPKSGHTSDVAAWMKGELCEWLYVASQLSDLENEEAQPVAATIRSDADEVIRSVATCLETGSLGGWRDDSPAYVESLVAAATALGPQCDSEDAHKLLSAAVRGLAIGRERAEVSEGL